MTAFGIPEEQPEHWKLDAWRTAIRQADTLPDLVALDFDLIRRAVASAKRGAQAPWVPEARRLIEQRRHEILAGHGDTRASAQGAA